MPVYIGKSGDLVGWYGSLTHSQTTEYSATQFGFSIKFKLSHAIKQVFFLQVSVGKSQAMTDILKTVKYWHFQTKHSSCFSSKFEVSGRFCDQRQISNFAQLS